LAVSALLVISRRYARPGISLRRTWGGSRALDDPFGRRPALRGLRGSAVENNKEANAEQTGGEH
jgi:hypothetical protein